MKPNSKISGYFIKRPREMYDSPAFRVLNLHELRCLHFFERAVCVTRKGHNVDLVGTYRDLKKYGVPSRHVARSLQVIERLGLIKRTEQGRGGYEGYRRPNKWQLTYIDTAPNIRDATHEWMAITTDEAAKAIAEKHRLHEARKHRPPPRRKPRRRVTENRKLPWSTPTVTEVTDLEEARLMRIQNGGEPGLDRRDIEWLARRYAAAEPDQADAWLRRRLADLVRPDYVEIEFVRVIEEIDASNRAGAR
jgi:hypothetical protein